MENEKCCLKVLPWYIVEPKLVKIKSTCEESNKQSPKMKSTTYFDEKTNKKAEKYLSERGKLEYTCLLVCSPCVN